MAVLTLFMSLLEVLQHYRGTIKLKKTRFFPEQAEFIGINLLKQGNTLAWSKYEPIRRLAPPTLFSDLQMLIRLIRFYQQWLPLYEVRISPWYEYLKEWSSNREASKQQEANKMKELWQPKDTAPLEQLKAEIIKGPILKRPYWNRWFYLKTNWSKEAMAAAIMQPECGSKEEEVIQQELRIGKCLFDKTLTSLRLRPIDFVCCMCKGAELNYHSSIGEAATGCWAVNKFKVYLGSWPFMWITECLRLAKFYEMENLPTHQMERWKQEMLWFDHTIVH